MNYWTIIKEITDLTFYLGLATFVGAKCLGKGQNHYAARIVTWNVTPCKKTETF